MIGESTERWKELCEQVSTEENPTKLLEVVQEVNRLLEEKRSRLNVNEADGGQGIKLF